MSASALLHARPGVLWAHAVLTAFLAVTWSSSSGLRGSEFSPSGEGGWFIRGDADQSGILEITDAIFTLNHLFLGGEDPYCLDALDADDDGQVLINDPVGVLLTLFSGTFVIPPPRPAAGLDPSYDGLSCDNGRFARLRREVFVPSCASCHSGASPAGELDLADRTAFSQLVLQPASNPAAGVAGFPRVKPGAPEESWLYRLAAGLVDPADSHEPDLTTLMEHEHIQLLERWIRNGAPASVLDDIALPPPASGEQIVIPHFDVPDGYGNEIQRNYYHKLKNPASVWVNRVEFISSPGIDHWNFFTYHSGNPFPGRPDGSFEDLFPLVSFRDWSLRASSQSERLDWKLPTGVGMQLGPMHQTLSQIHFTNHGRKLAPLGAKAVINLHTFEPDPAPVPLGSLIVQDRGIRLDEGSNYSYDYGVTFATMGHHVAVRLAAVQGHFHWRGQAFEMRLWDGLNKLADGSPATGEFDRMGPENTFYLSENGEDPPFLSFGDDGPEIPQGWGIVYRATFLNTDDMLYCFGSRAEYQEHSIAFIYFYPGPLLRGGFLFHPPACLGQGCTVPCF